MKIKEDNKGIFTWWHICVLLVITASCRTITQTQITEKNSSQVAINSSIAEDAETAEAIKPYKDSLDKIMNRVLAQSAQTMDKGQPESVLGNFVSDLVLEYINKYHGGADMAFFNNGGFRNSLPKGNITVQNVYELMPFDNEVVVLQMPGKQVNELVKYIASSGGIPVSGLQMKIKNNLPQDIYIGKVKFDSSKIYRVVTSDYLANGGDKFFFLQDKSVQRNDINLKLRDLLLQYIPEKASTEKILKAEKDGRITIVE